MEAVQKVDGTVNSESSDNRPHRRKWCRPGTVERHLAVCGERRGERHYDKTTFPSSHQRVYPVVLLRVIWQWKLRALQPPAGTICTCISQSANFSFYNEETSWTSKSKSHLLIRSISSSCRFLKEEYHLLLFLGQAQVAFSTRNSQWHTFYFGILKIHLCSKPNTKLDRLNFFKSRK